MTDDKEFDALGIAGILPLDYTFILDNNESIKDVKEELKSIPLPLTDHPRVGFQYVSFQRSGGGKIANILGYLGASGHDIARGC